jgi:1,4-alpha-glucan branching enzyme
MPVMEHPFRGSWGYQVTGYFAPTRWLGEPDDLRYLVDECHRHDIGVIVDWVPAHFPRDDWSLARFDGTPLYEHPDPRRGEHPDWGTYVFDYGRNEVRNFLVANALYWLDSSTSTGCASTRSPRCSISTTPARSGSGPERDTGDARTSRRSRSCEGDDHRGGRRVPRRADDRRGVDGLAGRDAPTSSGGLGFSHKWNLGWMHDTLDYSPRSGPPEVHHHDEMTFALLYAYDERFVLPLSHDEVVHGKGPGKKLWFMGSELAPWKEWDHEASLEWFLVDQPPHDGIYRCFRDLLALYRASPALWERDHREDGFRWIDFHDRDASVVSWARFGDDPARHVVTVLNLTPVAREDYVIGVPGAGPYREAVNTDSAVYGGGNVGNGGLVETEDGEAHGLPHRVRLTLPPIGALVLVPAGG